MELRWCKYSKSFLKQENAVLILQSQHNDGWSHGNTGSQVIKLRYTIHFTDKSQMWSDAPVILAIPKFVYDVFTQHTYDKECNVGIKIDQEQLLCITKIRNPASPR